MNIKIYIALILTCFNLKATALDCLGPDDLKSQFNSVLTTLSSKAKDINNILLGNSPSFMTVEDIFGHDYVLAKARDDIKKIRKEGSFIVDEHKFLASCLEKSSLTSQLNALEEASRQVYLQRLELLSKNITSNDALRLSLLEEGSLPTLQNEISQQRVASETTKRALERELIENEDLSRSDGIKNPRLKFLSSLLTKVKIELLNKKIERNEVLASKLQYFEEMSEKIRKISSKSTLNSEGDLGQYELVEDAWLKITQENFYQLLNNPVGFNLPKIPGLEEYSDILNNDKQSQKIIEVHASLKRLKDETISDLTTKKEKEIKLLNDLIIRVNSLRSFYFKKLKTSYVWRNIFSERGFFIIKSEVIASPYRIISYFYSKYLYVNEKISSGREGLIRLAGDIFLILFAFSFYFMALWSSNKTYSFIDNWFIKNRYSQKNQNLIRKLNRVWIKIKESFKDILLVLILLVLEEISYFRDYALIIDFFKIVLLSKALKSLVMIFLASVSKVDGRNFRSFKNKAELTSTKFKNIYLFYAITMLFIETTISSAYFYTIIRTLVFIYSLFIIFKSSTKWENEFSSYIEKNFSGVIVGRVNLIMKSLPRICRAPIIFIVIIILSFFDLVIGLTENFELSKKISANFFKKQIESVEAEEGADGKIPQTYKENFSLESLESAEDYIVPDEELERLLLLEIEDWVKEKSEEHCLVVYGDKGVGKTTLLKHLTKKVVDETNGELKLIYTKIPSKITSVTEMRSFFADVFSTL